MIKKSTRRRKVDKQARRRSGKIISMAASSYRYMCRDKLVVVRRVGESGSMIHQDAVERLKKVALARLQNLTKSVIKNGPASLLSSLRMRRISATVIHKASTRRAQTPRSL
jgi:hypothetical protein